MSELSSKLEQVIEKLVKAKEDALKFSKGNNVAGTRLRKAALTSINSLKELRKEVIAIRESRKK